MKSIDHFTWQLMFMNENMFREPFKHHRNHTFLFCAITHDFHGDNKCIQWPTFVPLLTFRMHSHDKPLFHESFILCVSQTVENVFFEMQALTRGHDRQDHEHIRSFHSIPSHSIYHPWWLCFDQKCEHIRWVSPPFSTRTLAQS